MSTTHRRFGLALLLLIALPAAGHHSPAMFDMTREVLLEGTVTEVAWRNPHVYLSLEVVGPDGRPVVQQIEAGPASNLVALGMDQSTVRPGDRVVVRAKPNRQASGRVVLGWLLTKADGTEIPLHVRAMAAPSAPGSAVATSIAGTWVPQGTGFAALSFAAREWPLTVEARAAITATEQARFEARAECVPFGPPALMALPATTIVAVSDAQVTFTLDVMDVERIVHLNQAHPAHIEPTLLGHSIGHWEGNTLVVDTVGYTAHPEGYAFDLPSSVAKHVVERFTLSADRKHLEYEALIEDPEYLAAPVTHRSFWDYRPEQKPSGLPCEPEVARRFMDE